MTKRNAIIPPRLPYTSEPSIPTTRPPGPEAKAFGIPETPPVSAEARDIVEGDKDFAAFQARLNAQINANTPTWRKVLYNIKGLLRKGK